MLKTLHKLGLDAKEPIREEGRGGAARRRAAALPDPATLGERMSGKTCAGTLVTGTTRGSRGATYLYHVVDNEWSMREYGAQAVVWQTALNPVVALELIDGRLEGRRRARPGGVPGPAVPRAARGAGRPRRPRAEPRRPTASGGGYPRRMETAGQVLLGVASSSPCSASAPRCSPPPGSTGFPTLRSTGSPTKRQRVRARRADGRRLDRRDDRAERHPAPIAVSISPGPVRLRDVASDALRRLEDARHGAGDAPRPLSEALRRAAPRRGRRHRP